MAGPVRISILADGSRARREFDQTARSGRSLGSILGKAGRVAAVGLSVGLLAATASAGKLAVAAAEDETSVALLTRTIDKNTDSTTRQIAANERWITSQGKLLGVTDDELRPALATLVTATKDLGRAQDLTSLAMDVAAGRGKSLESVSTALMKAENGQVSALARLGINTKNAKGETIGMNEAVKRMARTFGGAAQAKAQTLQGRINRLKVMATEAGEAIGYKLLPPLSDLAFKAADGLSALEDFSDSQIQPRLEDLAGWFRKNQDEIGDLARQLGDKLVPVLRESTELVTDAGKAVADASIPVGQKLVPALGDLLDVVGDVLGFVNDLPGPVKEIGVQAGIAALVFPRLAAGVATATAAVGSHITYLRVLKLELTDTAARSRLLTGAMGRLGGAAKAAAGIGGMVLLAQSTDTANQSLGFLGKTAAGGLLGGSVAGPWGAAIGTVAGAMYGLATATGEVAVEVVRAKDETKVYADTLDELTGKITAQTRARALDRIMADEANALLIQNATQYGVSTRDIVSATLGQEGALQRLRAAQNEAGREYERLKGKFGFGSEEAEGARLLTSSLGLLIPRLGEEGRVLRQNIKATRERALVTAKLGDIFKGLPKQTITAIRTRGIPDTRREIARLARDYKLTPKQIRTIIRATGTKTTVKEVQGVAASLKKVDDTKATLRGWLSGIKTAIGQGAKFSDRERKTIVTKLEAIEKARPNLSPYVASVRTAVQNAGSNAQGSTAVGAQLKQGLLTGMYGTGSALSAIMSGAVRDAIAAARAAARSNSPSKETMEIGGDLGTGLVIGVAAKRGAARKGGRDIVRSLLEGVTAGTSGVDKALSKISALVEKRVKGKGEEKRQRAILRGLKDEYRALRKNGQAQDKNTRRLEAATSKYKALVQAGRQYAATIKQGFVDYGNVVGLGVRDGSTSVSLTGLISQLEARAAASERFAALIKQLRGDGANQTTIQQLLDAGVEGGLATAEAIASGGSAAITQINALTSQIASTGSRLGEAMRKAYKEAGILAAQATVEGLKKRQRQLDRVAERMATALAKQLRLELGIKAPASPSAPRLGVANTYARTPALDAYRAGAGSTAQHQTVTLKLSAAEVSQLMRGKEMVADIDFYFRNGGTTRTMVKRV